MAPEPRPVFLSPHYDDVALSCGGTVAALADEGRRPLIVTVFAASPTGDPGEFGRFQHDRWGLGEGDPIAARRAEDRCAAEALGAEVLWLDFLDAIYRGERYTSDAALFGPLADDERGLAHEIRAALLAALAGSNLAIATLYVPLGAGNHVDHQLVREVGQLSVAEGVEVLAYEDYPYAGDPGREAELARQSAELSQGAPVIRPLSESQLERRIQAIRCYPSQLPVIFRFQGDPAEATRCWAFRQGAGEPAERFWAIE